MKIADLRKYFYINVLSIVTNIFYILWVISLFTLLPFLTKIGGPFDPVQDVYPGMVTYEIIIFWSFVFYLFLFVILIIQALKESKSNKKKFSDKLGFMKFVNSNNIFYNFVFWLGIIEIFLPIIFIFLYLILSILTEFF